MNLQEAYLILELSQSASSEDAKKKYKELTRKYHPDINKEEGAEDRFKKINEAYQCIINKEEGAPINNDFSFNHFQEFRSAFKNSINIKIENIILNTIISFKESVLGCQKNLQYIRNNKCPHCNGNGLILINNGCDKCGGKGQIISRQGNMIFTRSCDKCQGHVSSKSCDLCETKGYISSNITININVPGGVVSGNILKLSGFGHFIGNFIGIDQFSDIHLHLTVVPEDGLSLIGANVVSNINISLLEALSGTSKIVKTILGDKEICLLPLTKNKDEIEIPNLGVNGKGSHIVVINVMYPDNINDIVNLLSKNELNVTLEIDELEKN